MQLTSQRDQPGTQREYETIYVVIPEADADQIQSINTRIRRVIEDGQGKLMRVENWGKRKLAYEIRKQTRGIYLYWRYLSPPSLVSEIERNLRMLDPVLRYITVKIDENVDPDARPSDVDDERFAQAAHTVPDEEDIAMGRLDREIETDDAGADDELSTESEGAELPEAESQAAPKEYASEGEPAAEEPEAVAPEIEEPEAVADEPAADDADTSEDKEGER